MEKQVQYTKIGDKPMFIWEYLIIRLLIYLIGRFGIGQIAIVSHPFVGWLISCGLLPTHLYMEAIQYRLYSTEV